MWCLCGSCDGGAQFRAMKEACKIFSSQQTAEQLSHLVPRSNMIPIGSHIYYILGKCKSVVPTPTMSAAIASANF